MNQIHDSDPLLWGNTPLANEGAWNILTTGQETAHFQNPTIEQMLTQTN